ncbi:centromere protein J-like isoform X2 [Acanthaster planci]|uniref:Centromere protein J-like isoform X2 n=1 Tax=Acanthaster planci TaxID=133434 RepID=A0A8B7ZYY3_ACAPL|nr:centromere protein J-like isoform X2 [Acanthaster planci]
MMNDALSRTNAWVNRAGVVLDPTPVLASQPQPELPTQSDQDGIAASRREFPIPSELATAIMQLDASADQAEHQQAKEQARLLQRFQQLKQWQHQQQERLLRQQQEQLQLLQLEQQRVEQTLVAQRQKQWGGIQQIQQSPLRTRPGPHQQRNPSSSPFRSNLPDAVAKASIALGQTAGPLVLNPLLMNAQRDAQDPAYLRTDSDLASESASSVVEEGVYPLPDTASEMSFGVIEEDEEAVTPTNGQDEAKEQVDEDNAETDNSLDESLQDAAALNRKVSETSRPPSTKLLSGDDRPIQSALGSKAKTFEELLEQQLKSEAEKSPENPPQGTSKDSPRRAFLRKGAGTARFGVISKKPPKPPSPRMTHTSLTSEEPRAGRGKVGPGGCKKNNSGIGHKLTPLSMNKLSLVKKEGKEATKEDDRKKIERGKRGEKEEIPQMARKVATKPAAAATKTSQNALSKQPLPSSQPQQSGASIEQGVPGQGKAASLPAIMMDAVPLPHEEDSHGHQLTAEGAHPDDTIEMSFQMRMKEWERNEKVEQEELDEFELLEEAADDNASFASDASIVVNMIQRANERKQGNGISSNRLQPPSKSVLIQRQRPQRSDVAIRTESALFKSHDQSPDPSHKGKAHSGVENGGEDESFSVGDQTLTGDNEKEQSLESYGQGFSGRIDTEWCGAGSPTEEDSDMASQENDEVAALASQGRKRLVGQARGPVRDSTQKTDEKYTSSPDARINRSDSDEDGEDPGKEGDGEGIEDAAEDDAGKSSRPMKRIAVTSSHAVDVNFDDDESWGDFGEAESESIDDNEDEDEDDKDNEEDDDDNEDESVILAGAPTATSTPPPPIFSKGHKSVFDRREESTRATMQPEATASPPTSSLVSKLFPKLKPTQKTSKPSQEKAKAAQPPTKPAETSVAEGLQSKLLKEKLVELEAEIAKFRRENTALAKLREEREKGLAALDKEVVDFQNLKAEELRNLQDYKEEEMKKLRKERRTFEKYQKAARALPDKKDREEIELLKKQLSDLQEEMSRRETRWTASSTRLRDRIDILEKENTELREEVKLLEQQRLQAWKREEEKVKSNQPKPKLQVPVINKQKLPPLLTVLDPEPQPDVQDVKDTKREAAQENSKTAHMATHRQVTNSKPENAAAIQKTVESSEDDTPLSTQPRRPPQRKRSVRFDVDSSPQKQPGISTVAADESLDAFSTTTALGASSREMTVLDSRGREISEGNRSMNNNNDDDKEEIHHPDGKIEEIRNDGSRVITYSNQTRKEISADGQSVIVTFFNGDIKQIMPDQRVMYYYAQMQTTHTTYPDGLEIIQFSNNQTEKHYPNGTKEITFPDQTIKYLFPNGNEESIFPDGTVLRVEQNGNRTMEFPNGQREVHTAQYKRREFPDGTVKTVYPDGRQETRYSSGRIRVKDKDGRVILDKK